MSDDYSAKRISDTLCELRSIGGTVAYQLGDDNTESRAARIIEQLQRKLESAESRLGAVEDELRHSVSVMSIVRSWLMENVRGSTHWENCEREHATCRAISQLGGVLERLSRLNLTAGVVERTVTNEETQ